MNDFDFDSLFDGGSPLKKFVDVVQTANRNVCEYELDKLFERFSVYEVYAHQNGFLESDYSDFFYKNQDDIESAKISAYMTVTADIVTKVE